MHLPEEPKQQYPSRRYPRSKMGWASKERSTPEGYNKEEHAWRFQFSFPQPSEESDSSIESEPKDPVTSPPKKKKSLEERTALREKRIAQQQRASRVHAETALRKYNRANNTKFELVEVTAHVLFFEFGGGCYHYNFRAKTKDHHSSDSSMKLFFAEVNYCPRNEDDVLLCCIVGEQDSGHCYGCEGEQPMVIHPSSRAYGGGHTAVIDMPDSGSSSSDRE